MPRIRSAGLNAPARPFAAPNLSMIGAVSGYMFVVPSCMHDGEAVVCQAAERRSVKLSQFTAYDNRVSKTSWLGQR